MLGLGIDLGLGSRKVGGGVPTISGTPPNMIIGQPYSFQYAVSPSGSTVTFGTTEAAFFAAHSITHNGTGLLISASVT